MSVLLGSASLCLFNCVYGAQDALAPLRLHGDWWAGMDIGAGAVELDLPAGGVDENWFYLNARIEYILNPHWNVGLEAGGWLIEPGEIEYNSSPPPADFERQLEGEGLAPVLLTARFYPWQDSGWYVKAGAGYVSHWVTDAGETSRKSGEGVMVAAGHDFVISANWDLTSYISYSSGSAGDEDYDAITLAIGLSYKIRPR